MKLYISHDFDDVKHNYFILISVISERRHYKQCCFLLYTCDEFVFNLWYVGRKGFYSRNCPSPSTSLNWGFKSYFSESVHSASSPHPPAPHPFPIHTVSGGRESLVSRTFSFRF